MKEAGAELTAEGERHKGDGRGGPRDGGNMVRSFVLTGTVNGEMQVRGGDDSRDAARLVQLLVLIYLPYIPRRCHSLLSCLSPNCRQQPGSGLSLGSLV